MKLGINASRARSGGAYTHLIGILSEANPASHGFSEVHLWAHGELLAKLPSYDWLKKHSVDVSNNSMLSQLIWERFQLTMQLESKGCEILLNVDAGSVCRFRPSVTMSRDMLSYEPGEMARYGVSKARFRLLCLKFVQNASLRAATGVIFLTRYAGAIIQGSAGNLARVAYIPHGVSDVFRLVQRNDSRPVEHLRPVRCLYVSNVAPYKHQWHVIDAIRKLRDKGLSLNLTLTGGGNAAKASESMQRLNKKLEAADPDREFVEVLGYIDQKELPDLLGQADIFVFASSCENMPNTLVEAMASGLPIACSSRGPMPEVLRDGGLYFDPEDSDSIAAAIKELISDSELRDRCAARAKELSSQFSWSNCAERTFAFLADISVSKETKD